MDVSIIIVNYNTPQLVADCVESVKLLSSCHCELIVVDNASTDDSVEILSAIPAIQLVRSSENLGFGRANNLGVLHAKGDYLFFLNPDTKLLNDAPTILHSYLVSHKTVGCAGGNLYSADLQPIHSFSRLFPSILREMDFACMQIYTRLRYGKSRQFNFSDAPMQVAFITGADLMISRQLFNEVGGFDSEFFMYYEDSALCYKVHTLGRKIMSVPQAQIIHLEGKSFSYSAIREERIQTGRYIFFHKFYSAAYNHIADCLNLLTMQIAIAVCRMLGKSDRREKYSCRRTIYKKLISPKTAAGKTADCSAK